MTFLKTLALIVSLLPTLIDAVKAVEEKITGAGMGTAKLEMVRDILQAAWDASASFESIWPTIKTVIDAIVAVFNRFGLFRTDGAETPAEG